MSTILQQNLAKEIIKNVKRKKPLNKKELVVSSGYSEISAESSSHIILQQEGVIEALEDFGFSVENAKRVVGSILNNEKVEPSTRLRASEQVFKVHGTYAPEKSVNVNIQAESSEEIKKLADELNQLHKDS